jgi:hypothetical protein
MSIRTTNAEKLALQIVRALATLGEGFPQACGGVRNLIETIAGAEAALQAAVDNGWVHIDGGSICLTNEGHAFVNGPVAKAIIA